ncbi:hypothetical protein [Undibacterium sp. RuTC16W]|uniref:hypothetical protein n=1 Tax=Undibacterium sp. RuTC16W TaxID=3413048 RepID=UPI003BF28577
MQTVVTMLILVAAFIYLVVKWMPSTVKQGLVVWISPYSPKLASALGAPASGCGSGCSSCGSCDSSTQTGVAQNQLADNVNKIIEKPVRFVRR